MRKKVLSLDSLTESLFSTHTYNQNLFDEEDEKYNKMIQSLKNILDGELTERQKICVLMYYGETMKMKDIAKKLGIGISSVSRHIKKAKNRVAKTMNYYF